MSATESLLVYKRNDEPVDWPKWGKPLAQVFYHPFRNDFNLYLRKDDGSFRLFDEFLSAYQWERAFHDFKDARPSFFDKVISHD